jgi:hypothetical protein
MRNSCRFDASVFSYFRKIVKIETNEPIDIVDLLLSSAAFARLGVYAKKDLQEAADLISLCLKWVPKDRFTAAKAT